MKRKTFLLAGLGALAWAGSSWGQTQQRSSSGEAETSDNAPPADTLQVDPALFSVMRFDWTDTSRQRSVPAILYLPARIKAEVTMPLVVFSHGMGGSREGYTYLGRFFAAQGYASLHVQHVGSDRQLWSGSPWTLVWRLEQAASDKEALNRVQDVRFALDQLLMSVHGSAVDLKRITMAGHSYGANTSMLLVGAKVDADGQTLALRDPRFSSAVLLSAPPFYGRGDPSKILADVEVPTLHITSTGDTIQIPGYNSGYEDRVGLYRAISSQSQAPKVLAVFKDGSHSMFTDRRNTGGTVLNPQVKIATRQLIIAFLNGVYEKDTQALQTWPKRFENLLAQFEARPEGTPGVVSHTG
jgi:dienelactone hydrolase